MPIKIRPNVGTAPAAGRAGEFILEIGQPHLIGPLVGVHPDTVRASEVEATIVCGRFIVAQMRQQAAAILGAHAFHLWKRSGPHHFSHIAGRVSRVAA